MVMYIQCMLILLRDVDNSQCALYHLWVLRGQVAKVDTYSLLHMSLIDSLSIGVSPLHVFRPTAVCFYAMTNDKTELKLIEYLLQSLYIISLF